jgi:hypothetical protein
LRQILTKVGHLIVNSSQAFTGRLNHELRSNSVLFPSEAHLLLADLLAVQFRDDDIVALLAGSKEIAFSSGNDVTGNEEQHAHNGHDGQECLLSFPKSSEGVESHVQSLG